MEVRTRGSYELAGRELVAEGSDLRVQVLTLAAGQCVPWHYHNDITDAFVCLEGPMVVETRAPRAAARGDGRGAGPGAVSAGGVGRWRGPGGQAGACGCREPACWSRPRLGPPRL